MATITTKDGVEIFYKDWGKGQPIVFSHGWPLSADDWDTQMLFFLEHGYRVIAHDRGFRCSSPPTEPSSTTMCRLDRSMAITGLVRNPPRARSGIGGARA